MANLFALIGTAYDRRKNPAADCLYRTASRTCVSLVQLMVGVVRCANHIADYTTKQATVPNQNHVRLSITPDTSFSIEELLQDALLEHDECYTDEK